VSRSKTPDAADAFELFLDTACNAFGGVIFIALLVIVMLQLSSIAPPMVAQDPLRDAENERKLRELRAQIESLERTRRVQDAQIEALGPRSDPALLTRYKELSAQESRETARSTTASAAASSARERLRALAEQREKAAARAAELARMRAEEEAALQRAMARPATRVRVPRYHESGRTQIGVLVEGGRLAVWQREVAVKDAGAASISEVEVDAGGERRKAIRLKPGHGLAVQDDANTRAAIELLLKPLDKRDSYLMFAVWPDSYAGFVVVRDIAVSQGFDYGLLLLGPDETVKVGVGPGGTE